jgi:hypothetical protein
MVKYRDSIWRSGVLQADAGAFEKHNAFFFRIGNGDMVAACGTL